jgi:glycosyltransferase involved in cell wall biosynthesis
MVSPLAYPPYIGGVETHVWDISRRLVTRGHEVEIYSTDPSCRLERVKDISGVRFRRFSCIAPAGIYNFSTGLYRSLRKANADVVHCHSYQNFSMLAAALAKSHNHIPLVASLHLGASKVGRLPYKLYDPSFGRIAVRSADKIVCVSPVETSLISPLKGIGRRLVLIPNGIDLEEISLYLQRAKLQKGNRGTVRIVHVGRLEKRKGVLAVIQAFREIAPLGNVELWVVGEGPLRMALLEAIRSANLRDKVQVRSHLSRRDLYEILACSQIFVLPSEFEAHSIALTEAMAFGLVPVVTSVGGNPFIVSSGLNGFLMEYPPDTRAISNVLRRMLRDPPLMNSLGRAAMRKAQEFNIERNVAALEDLYYSLGRH